MARLRSSKIAGARIFSVSISDQNLLKWMDNNPTEIHSLSAVLRDSLLTIKKQWEMDNDEDLMGLKLKVQNWVKIVNKQREFLESKGILDEFIEFDNNVEKPKPQHMIQEKNTNLNNAELTKKDRKKVLEGSVVK